MLNLCLLFQLKLLEEELEQAKKEMKDLRESSDIKDKKIQELELEILRSSNKMAAMATDHAQQMQNLTDEINRLKVTREGRGYGIWYWFRRFWKRKMKL